jgi:hypothetical protein
MGVAILKIYTLIVYQVPSWAKTHIKGSLDYWIFTGEECLPCNLYKTDLRTRV